MDPDPGNLTSLIVLLDATFWNSIWMVFAGVWVQVLFFVFLLAFSFLVSGAEIAFFSLTPAELAGFGESSSRLSQRIHRLMEDENAEKRLLATILITNNFVNVAAILVASYILHRFAGEFEWGSGLQTLLDVLLITGLLLLFGEIVPKVFASKNRIRFVRLLATPLFFLRRVLALPARLLVALDAFIFRQLFRNGGLRETNASLEDLRHAINLTTHRDEHRDEKEILKGIVNFSNIPVKSIMRARVDVSALEINTPPNEIIEFIQEHSFSRLPVYEENLDHIKGVLHIKDLLPFLSNQSSPISLKELLRDVHFVPESKKIDALLDEFKRRRLHMAVVVDEFGGTAGIVTLEDVIEEIFGEISDEFDSEDWVYTKKSDNTYIFEGRISLIDVKKIVGLDDEVFEDARGDSDSLGGLILELHGKIPVSGEIIHYHNFELHVESVRKHRITMVKMVINEPGEDED